MMCSSYHAHALRYSNTMTSLPRRHVDKPVCSIVKTSACIYTLSYIHKHASSLRFSIISVQFQVASELFRDRTSNDVALFFLHAFRTKLPSFGHVITEKHSRRCNYQNCVMSRDRDSFQANLPPPQYLQKYASTANTYNV